MSVARTVAEVIKDHVVLEVESLDRMYLNLYVPRLQYERGVAGFWRNNRGHTYASSALMGPMTKAFVQRIEAFVKDEGLDLLQFRKGDCKEDIGKRYREQFEGDEGVLFVGKAQEKASVFRTRTCHNPETNKSYASLYRSTAMVNHYYFYCVDDDFGPFFLKFCSYFPYGGRLLINGHEYAKRQLEKEGIQYEALDNGVLSCADPVRLQEICNALGAEKIEALARKWLRVLPHPYTADDQFMGYCYDISILQAEFSLTQVLDRPVTGRVFFENVIRENLDIGRPDRVQLVFGRRVTRRTPGRFRTRVITHGVAPSLYIDYKSSHVKQYHKEGRALRTETTINNTYDFGVKRRLKNFDALRRVGYAANRRLLEIQRTSHDCAIGEDVFVRVHQPAEVNGQRASAFRFGDPRVLALFLAIVMFCFLPRGFSNKDLREKMAQLLGLEPGQYSQGRMTYDLRRLRLHGFIERISRTHRYRVTDFGRRTALFLLRHHNRVLQSSLSVLHDRAPPIPTEIRAVFDRIDREIDRIWERQSVAA